MELEEADDTGQERKLYKQSKLSSRATLIAQGVSLKYKIALDADAVSLGPSGLTPDVLW